MLNILYEDEAVLVVWKPVGMESQSAVVLTRIWSVRSNTIYPQRERWIITTCPQSQWNLMWGVIHRLDKPVSGVMVYAKTKSAAAALE